MDSFEREVFFKHYVYCFEEWLRRSPIRRSPIRRSPIRRSPIKRS